MKKEEEFQQQIKQELQLMNYSSISSSILATALEQTVLTEIGS